MKTKDTPLCKVYALNPKYWSIECKSVFLPSSSAWNVSLVVTNPFLGTFLKSEKKFFFEGKSLIFWGSTWQSEENIPEGSSNFNLLLVYSKRKKNRSEIEFHTQIHTTGQRNMQGWCSLGDPAVNLHFRPQPFCGKRKEWLAFSVPPWLCAPVRALVCQDPVWKLRNSGLKIRQRVPEEQLPEWWCRTASASLCTDGSTPEKEKCNNFLSPLVVLEAWALYCLWSSPNREIAWDSSHL